MNLYEKFVLPRIIDIVCSCKPTMKQRQKIVPLATGKVLEIGMGSGLNIRYMDPSKIRHVWGLDPSDALQKKSEEEAHKTGISMEFIKGIAEDIPLENHVVDSILITYTLCTLPDVQQSLEEFRRVLKPGGKLFFCEHGAAPDENVKKWQDRINPYWSKLGGGCNLNRKIPSLIKKGGFQIEKIETMYVPGWKPLSFNYWGSASPL